MRFFFTFVQKLVAVSEKEDIGMAGRKAFGAI